MQNFYKIGHRGAAGYAPENTLLSIKKALELKVDAIEFDIHRCQTGELVVIHDEKVDRTTDGSGEIVRMSLEKIKTFDAGLGEKIPTLDEVLDLIDGKSKVNIELKGKGTAKPLADLIVKKIASKKWELSDFIVSSFDRPKLEQFHGLAPDIWTGIIYTRPRLFFLQKAKKIGVKSIHLSKKFVSRKITEKIHLAGLKLFIYTVNEPDEIKKIRQLSVDGIFSNFPDRL
ncbi:MAG: glycerophosphodiester phosphodiesterase family protein [Patescibacteria group bacterium]|jgi:glycerophosphoryl diester phosphodiesterase